MSPCGEERRALLGSDSEQLRQHQQHVAESEARGECWASGYPIPICKARVCDCFDSPDVAAQDQPDLFGET